MEDNVMYDAMIAGATASLIAMSHSGIVSDNFDTFHGLMVFSFNDMKFLEDLGRLRPGGQVTRGIRLSPENDAVCFATRLWFRVKRSSSRWWDGYYVSIGINLRESDRNVTGIRKLEISRLAVGGIEDICQKINADGFREDCLERLTEHVYSSCYESVYGLMGYPPEHELKDEQQTEKATRPSLLIDFGSALSSVSIDILQDE